MKSRARCIATEAQRVYWRTALALFLVFCWGVALTSAEESKKAIKRDGNQPKSGVEAMGTDAGQLVEKLSKQADQGQAEAQYELGVIYLKGKGISKDYGQAASLMRRAAERGIADAQYQLGLLYLTGDGVMKDYAQAAKWIRMAADQGLADAQYDYGMLCYSGDGVPKDFAEAAKWYEMAAEQDHRHAKYALERLRSAPLITPEPQPKTSIPEAVPEPPKKEEPRPQEIAEDSPAKRARLLKSALRGDADAQFQLGMMYEKGEDVSKDYGETLKWYRKAAKQGHQGAKQQLLKTVEDLHKLSASGVDGLIKLAQQGDAWVQTMVAYRYMEGMGIPRDRGEALKWFRKAAEQGEAVAQYNLGTMYWRGIGVPKNDEEALKWYLKSAEQGEPSAQYNLGTMYWLGLGVPKDRREAEKWFRKAADQGSVEADMALAQMGVRNPK